MTDIVVPAQRSSMMASIKSKNTGPEIAVRKALFNAGFRFRLHRKDLPGNPDIVLPGRRVAIFVHGCFWHSHFGCKNFRLPTSREEFWGRKLGETVARDGAAKEKLQDSGWRVLVVWECFVRASRGTNDLPAALIDWLTGNASYGELSAIATCRLPNSL